MRRSGRGIVIGDRLAALLKEVARGFSRSLQVRLTEHMVTPGQYAFLRVLWAEDGVTQHDLAARVGLTEPTTSTTVNSLVKLGYVRRVRKPDDRKRIYVVLTPAGRQLEVDLASISADILAIATTGLKEDDLATMRRCLLTLDENLAMDELRWPEEQRRLLSNRDLARLVRGDDLPPPSPATRAPA